MKITDMSNTSIATSLRSHVIESEKESNYTECCIKIENKKKI